eukprot:c51648_g1_i1 orf=97-258(+)
MWSMQRRGRMPNHGLEYIPGGGWSSGESIEDGGVVGSRGPPPPKWMEEMQWQK